MKIEFADFIEGAASAKGIAVIIDVFRAFTTACYCIDRGAEALFAVGDSTTAVAMAARYDQPVLLGERFGRPLEGFDYGNSPSVINSVDLRGKTLLHTTHAGTQGLVNATAAEQVLTGAFVNARATINYIEKMQPDCVTLVRMGLHANEACDEDWACADYLAALLRRQPVDEVAIARQLRASPYAARFFDPQQPWNPPADVDCCLAFNRFDFTLSARKVSADACQLEIIG